MASSASNSRKASVSEDKENDMMVPSMGAGGAVMTASQRRDEKISVKERTKTFNRMASEVELINVLKDQNRNKSSSRKSSRSQRGSSSQRDEADSNDSSSIGTLDTVSKTWMLCAARCDYLSIVKLLRDDPRLAKAKDFTNGYTALHWACKHGNLDLVKLLAGNYGANVNAKSHGGYTPLHLACQFGHQEVFDILVKAYGADPNLRDNSGKKPRQYMQMTVANSVMGLQMSNDTFRQLKDRRRNRARQVAEQNNKTSSSSILRFGSLSVKVKKTTEAFNNYFGHKTSSDNSSQQPYSLPTIGAGSEDSLKMPPPKFGVPATGIKKRRSKRAMDFQTSMTSSKSAPVTPTESRSPIKEERASDSDSEYGFDSQWTHPAHR